MLTIKLDQQAIRKRHKAQRIAVLGDCLGCACIVLALIALYVILPN